MQVPKDRFQCYICGSRPEYITCEACLETICHPCTEIVWAIRNNFEYAHLLCKDCANEEP